MNTSLISARDCRVLMNRIRSYKRAGNASRFIKAELYPRQVCSRWERRKDTGSQHLQKGYRTGVIRMPKQVVEGSARTQILYMRS